MSLSVEHWVAYVSVLVGEMSVVSLVALGHGSKVHVVHGLVCLVVSVDSVEGSRLLLVSRLDLRRLELAGDRNHLPSHDRLLRHLKRLFSPLDCLLLVLEVHFVVNYLLLGVHDGHLLSFMIDVHDDEDSQHCEGDHNSNNRSSFVAFAAGPDRPENLFFNLGIGNVRRPSCILQQLRLVVQVTLGVGPFLIVIVVVVVAAARRGIQKQNAWAVRGTVGAIRCIRFAEGAFRRGRERGRFETAAASFASESAVLWVT